MISLKELEEAGVATIFTGKAVIFDLKEANRHFKSSALKESIAKVYYHDGRCGDVLLREFGLSGYWAELRE